MRVVQWYEAEAEANGAAATLVERGIGAEVTPGPPPVDGPPAPDASVAPWAGAESAATESLIPDPANHFGLAVLAEDVARAREILGLPDPDTGADDRETELKGSVRSLLIPVLFAVAVLVAVPLLAFFITFKLQGG